MFGDIHVEFKCSRCGETENAKVDYWISCDGSPQLMMETGGGDRLASEGWAFEERVGKFEHWQTPFVSRCYDCSCRLQRMRAELAKKEG